MKKALTTAIISSFFFAFTFVLNRSMNLNGGYWLWNAVLRYLFTLPLCFILLIKNRQTRPVLQHINKNKKEWFLWSTVGFGLFYTPLSAASVFAESWFTAAAWQVTIVCGVLLTPLFHEKIPIKNLMYSCLIIIGVFIMQIPHARLGLHGIGRALLLIIIAAFSYPLGNRKMMEVCKNSLTVMQRVFGMTLCSMPFWILMAFFAFQSSGLPADFQIFQSFLVALFSGVIATVLFFGATDMVQNNPKQLSVIESTQCGEVLFTLILGILLLHDPIPDIYGWIGLFMIVTGMILNSLNF